MVWVGKLRHEVLKHNHLLHSLGVGWETKAGRGKQLSPCLLMGILPHQPEMQTEPQVGLSDESREWYPGLEVVLQQLRAALG